MIRPKFILGLLPPTWLFQKSLSQAVSCGNHQADTCEGCPQGNGAAWCNGECLWWNDNCVLRSDFGECTAVTCNICGLDQCQSESSCEWMTTTNLCRPYPSETGFTASIHLDYVELPVDEPAWAFTQIKITDAVLGSYFSTSVQSFGYGGFQVHGTNPYTGRTIFSIWDQGCDRDLGDSDCSNEQLAVVKACGTGVVCQDFGNEGTGQQSFFETSEFPLVNETYAMMTHAVPVQNNRVQYSGYYFAQDHWHFLSTIEINHSSEDWWHHRCSNFVEQYIGSHGLSKRAANFGPFYVSKAEPIVFQQVQSAVFNRNTDHNHKRVNGYVTSENTMALEIGGDVVQQNPSGTRLEVAPAEAKPTSLTLFETLIPCLEAAAVSTGAIEACLQATTTGQPATSSPSAGPGPTMPPTILPTNTPDAGPAPTMLPTGLAPTKNPDAGPPTTAPPTTATPQSSDSLLLQPLSSASLLLVFALCVFNHC